MFGKQDCPVTYRRLIALSNCHVIFVAPSTSTPVSSCPTPFICTRNSVLILLEPSDSDSLRVPANESTSSIKIIAGLFSRAISNSCLTNLENMSSISYIKLRRPTYQQDHECRRMNVGTTWWERKKEKGGRLTVQSHPATCSQDH